jgi:hypothetical protein
VACATEAIGIFAGVARDGLNATAIRLLHLRPESSNLHLKK